MCGNFNTNPYDAPKLEAFFYSKDNVMEIRFVSDYSNDLPDLPSPVGFVAHYVEEDDWIINVFVLFVRFVSIV